jgi:hypothetical protein
MAFSFFRKRKSPVNESITAALAATTAGSFSIADFSGEEGAAVSGAPGPLPVKRSQQIKRLTDDRLTVEFFRLPSSI